MTKAIMPINVTRIHSHQPCDGCSLRYSKYKATLNPPGSARVTHRLCDTCIEAIKQ